MSSQNVTKRAKSAAKRRYDDACGLAHALDLIGERWALMVLRELMLGGKRFSELRADLPGISANVLTQRLEELEQRGLLVRRRLPPPASAQVYELTPWGLEAEPIIQTLGRWAVRSPAHDPTLPISAVSAMLSLRTMVDLAKVGARSARIGFRFGHESYVATLTQDALDIARGEPDGADFVMSGMPQGLTAAIYGKAPFDALAAQDMLHVTGDLALACWFTTLFELPPKAF